MRFPQPWLRPLRALCSLVKQKIECWAHFFNGTDTMDGRHTSGTLATKREFAMAAILNGEATPEDLALFPCAAAALQSFPTTYKTRYPTAGKTERIGGLGKHHDLRTAMEMDAFLRGELKVAGKKATKLDVLTWRPWKDTVQFLQGQLKSEIGKRFLGDCGDMMIEAWFTEVVKPFSAAVPAAEGMTLAGYKKVMESIDMGGKREAAALAFIQALRDDSTLQRGLQEQWLAFEVRWLSSHALNVDGLFQTVKEILEEKDVWICVSKSGVNLIEGLKAEGLRYEGARQKRQGGMSFHYTLTLSRGGETKEVPMECKFHWKNGGQAVQNLNFMLL